MAARRRDIFLDIVFIVAGALVYATAVTSLTAPNNIAPGGVTGLCTMLNFMFGTPIGLMSFFINIPIILWAVVDIGYKLVVRTVAALAVHRPFHRLYACVPGESGAGGGVLRGMRGTGTVPDLYKGGDHRRD